jgi:hypothetical protein
MFQREDALIGEGESVVIGTTWAANHGRINKPMRAQEEVSGAPATYPKRATRPSRVDVAAAVICLTRAPNPELVGIVRRPRGGHWAQSGPSVNGTRGYCSPTVALG